jgi:hypothetical protein
MPNEKFTQLPTVPNATLADIICAVQGGISVQETLSQVQALMLSQTILSFAGNPNSNLAGNIYQLCWDITDMRLYVCTTTGTALTAVWTAALNGIVSPALGGTGVANPTANGIAIAEGSADFHFIPLTNGQFLIGSTSTDPVANTLGAGPGITIMNTAGQVIISGTGLSGFVWNDVTGTSLTMVSGNGYVADNSSLVTLTLPTTSIFGDVIQVVGKNTGGWAIAQNAGQTIHFGDENTTTGVTGSLASTNQYDAMTLVCTIADTDWTVAPGTQGNITVDGGETNNAINTDNTKGITAIVTQTFTSSGTYTPTLGMIDCIAEVVGGGAAGGGTPTASGATGTTGGGGGGGGYSRSRLTAAQIGASQAITVGAGGIGSVNATGGNGGSSSVGSLVIASGGFGGAAGLAAAITNARPGGVGASEGTGDDTFPGSYGLGGVWYASDFAYSGGGGAAGNGLGGAAAPVITTSSTAAGTAATANTGAGGSGSTIDRVVGTTQAGGNGGSGIVIITEFVST